MRSWRHLLVFWALGELATLPAGAAGPLRPGRAAPAFSLAAVDGKRLTLAALRGKPVYLDFFATWCAPCREETPGIVKLARIYAGRGLVVAAIDDQESKDKAEAFRDEFKLPFGIGLGDQKTIDAYGVIALPVHVFIDRKGIVREYRLGEMSYAETERGIKAIL